MSISNIYNQLLLNLEFLHVANPLGIYEFITLFPSKVS